MKGGERGEKGLETLSNEFDHWNGLDRSHLSVAVLSLPIGIGWQWLDFDPFDWYRSRIGRHEVI